MKPFYNIIKIATNATAGESIAIGLFAYNGTSYFVQFSNNKKKIAKKLLESGSELVDYLSKHITTKADELNKILLDDKSKLFESTSLIDSDYFNYLSRYSNNILQFSNSYLIKESIDDKKFQKLFSLFIDHYHVNELVTVDMNSVMFQDRINTKLIDRVKDKVHTSIQLTQEIIPSLYFNYELDCIGLNGVFTGAKSIDFSKSEIFVDKAISHYFQIIMLLSKIYQRDKKDNNFYLIGDEPDNNKIWKQLKKQNIVKLIHSEESDIVAQKIEETNAHTFLEI